MAETSLINPFDKEKINGPILSKHMEYKTIMLSSI